ncbi:MAG TPA: hypothetical protein VFQ39_06020 [Longimicrobium sp.]|nr:hypothetical protein [Longimicrobium sp.]
MKKLRLDPDALRVESFTPRETTEEPGTVFGRWVSTRETCSYSVMNKCFAPEDTATMDVYNDGCNTIACQGGPGFTQIGCATNAYC